MCEIQCIDFLKGKVCRNCKRAYLRSKYTYIAYRRDFEPGIQRVINDLKQGCENSPFNIV